jgi:histidinol-phosphatase
MTQDSVAQDAIRADLALALDLAARADAVTMDRFGALDLRIETKPDLTPVTDADRSTEIELRDALAQLRPDDEIFGEEFGGTASFEGRQWVLDPIDGTKNFVRNVPAWATLIALYDQDEPLAGVVSAPALGRRWWAARGAGAWAKTFDQAPRPIHVSKVARLSDASLSYASLSGWFERDLGEAFIALTQQAWRTRAYGDFWSYMLLAEGAVDLAAEPELAVWDMAALVPIVVEAGGRFTGLDGVPGPFQGNAAASNGQLHDELLAALGR